MAKTALQKASGKMFGDFGPSVPVASPSGGGRMSPEERERIEKEAEKARGEQERRKAEEILSVEAAGADEAKQQPATESKPRRGRPSVRNTDEQLVFMNFRVPADFRQKVKVMAAQQGVTAQELFDEAFAMLFKRHGLS